MRKLLIIFLSLLSILSYAQTVYYCQDTSENANASDANAGTDIDYPWASWQHAFETPEAGDTVYFRGGVWYPDSHYSESVNSALHLDPHGKVGAAVGNDGESDAWIYFWAYPSDYAAGNFPILDCSQVDTVGEFYNTAISFYWCNYFHLKGLTVRNAYQINAGANSVVAGGVGAWTCSNFIYENMTIYNMGGRGNSHFSAFGVPEGEGGPIATDADTTRWINCDIYNCADPYTYTGHPEQEHDPYNAADGWKVQNYFGGYFLFDGCRAWNCSDDGFDPSGSQLTVIKNCWSFYNGWYGEGVLDGNGIKTGGVSDSIAPSITRIIKGNVTAFNAGAGIYHLDYAPSYRNISRVYNNTTCYNHYNFLLNDSTQNPGKSFLGEFYNNISYASDNGAPMAFSYSWHKESHNVWDAAINAWGGVWTDTVTISDADFVTVDSTTLMTLLLASRQSDGSLPASKPFTLAEGSDMIDMGKTIISGIDTILDAGTIEYYGLAPDIGAYEYESDLIEVDSIHIGSEGLVTTIETDGGTLQMYDTIWPGDASFQDVTWSDHPGTGDVSINQSGLVTAQEDGTDTIRATAQDGTGIYDDWILTISNQDAYVLPTVITSVTSAAHSVQATCGGNVTANGGAAVTAKGICWNTSINPTTANSFTVDGTGTSAFTSSMTNLNNSTLYYVRAYATNSEGTAYGDNRQVTTSAYSVLRGANKSYRLNGKTVVL